MDLKEFRYYLLYDGATFELPHAPIGHEDTITMFKRDMKYWGVLRSFSFPMDFVLASGIRLKELLLTKGVDFIASLRIDRLNRSTLRYEVMYQGELDLSKTEVDNTKISIPLMDGDLQAKIKAYENTKYEYNMDNYVNVEMLGADFVDYANVSLAASTSRGTSKIIGINIESSDITLRKIDVFSPSETDYTNSAGKQIIDLRTSGLYFIQCNEDVSISLKATINCNFKNGFNGIMRYNILICDNTSYEGGNQVLLASTGDYADTNQYDNIVFNVDKVLDLKSGRKYFLLLQSVYYNVLLNDMKFSINEAIMRLSYAGTSTNFNVRAIKPGMLFEKIINSIRPYTLCNSSLLEDSQLLITSGDAIRGLVDPKIKTSFSDFYKSINSVFCIGFSSHGNKAVLENREFFFRNTNQVALLDNVKELTYKPFSDIMYSNILVGYPNETYENERGREEFNQGQNWVTPSYRVQNTLDIKSVYRADQFGIDELIKKQLTDNTDNATNTDAQGDNDIFMLWVKKNPVNGVYQLVTAADFSQVSGVSDRTYTYNLDISPKHNLMRHMDFIRSSFWGVNENGFISLASSDKNADISVKQGNDIVREREPIYIQDYTNRILIPFMVTFKTDYNRNIMNDISNTPEGFIKFKWNNSYFSAYIYDVKIDLSRNSEQEFTVILSKDNNINNLL